MRDWLTISKIFYFVVVGAALAVIMFVDHNIAVSVKADLKYTDFITILLAILGVMLTALTAILATLALISWRNFGARVRTHVDEYMKEFVEPSNSFKNVQKVVRDNANRVEKYSTPEGEVENLSEFDEDVV